MISFRKHDLEKLCKIGKFQFTQSEKHTYNFGTRFEKCHDRGWIVDDKRHRTRIGVLVLRSTSLCSACVRKTTKKVHSRKKKDIRVPSATKYGGEHWKTSMAWPWRDDDWMQNSKRRRSRLPTKTYLMNKFTWIAKLIGTMIMVCSRLKMRENLWCHPLVRPYSLSDVLAPTDRPTDANISDEEKGLTNGIPQRNDVLPLRYRHLFENMRKHNENIELRGKPNV